MPNPSFLRSAAFGLILLLPISAGWGNVKVTHKPVEVEHKSFDPGNPPKELGLEREGAVTASEFDLQIGLDISPGEKRPQRNGKCQQSMVIQNVKLTLGLKITVWLPDTANDKLKAHEEGHVQMTERVYADRADKAAKAAGALIDGLRMTAEADNCDDVDKALEQTIGEANKKVYHAYLARTADVSAGRVRSMTISPGTAPGWTSTKRRPLPRPLPVRPPKRRPRRDPPAQAKRQRSHRARSNPGPCRSGRQDSRYFPNIFITMKMTMAPKNPPPSSR